VGREVVKQARSAGHAVVAVLRGEAPFAPDGVELVRGDVLDPAVAMKAIAGADVVVSALGIKRRNPMNPWSPVDSPKDFATGSAGHIVAAMKAHGVRRVAAISAGGVGTSKRGLNVGMRVLLATSNVGVMYADLEGMEKVYSGSGLDWQCVRPVTLTNGPQTYRVAVVDRFTTTMTIRRADVAMFLLDEIRRAPFFARTPLIAGI
jgi:putative NADH-flavin reductase